MEKQKNKIVNKVLGGNRFRPCGEKFKNAHVGADSISAQGQRGITLIALVITIIILLILAGVVLNLTLGEHGILKRASEAGEQYKISEILEKLELEKVDLYARKNGETPSLQEYIDHLINKGIISASDVENKEYIKEVNKDYIAKYNDADSVSTTQDKIWILSCSEVWNNGIKEKPYGYDITKEGDQYKYYEIIDGDSSTADPGLVKKSGSSARDWWLRSPVTDEIISCVSKDGKASNSYDYKNLGAAPAFSI